MSSTVDNNKRFLVSVTTINDSDRIRRDYGDIDELAHSISTLGLLQPIVIKLDGTLIAGGRRLRAMKKLGWTDIPVTYFEVADDITLRILEVEENVRRKQMSWQERTLAVAEVHAKQAHFKALHSERWTQQATGELLGMAASNVNYCLELASYIRQGDKEIAKCDRMWDALNLIVKRKAEESNKALAKLTLPVVNVEAARKMLEEAPLDDTSIFSTPTESSGGVGSLSDDGEVPGGPQNPAETIVVPLSKMCLHGDSPEVLKNFADNSVDHVITDWPFAIEMDFINQSGGEVGMKNLSDTAAQHTVAGNIELHTKLIPELFRVLKPNGFFITFLDTMQWQTTYDQCIAAGFKVQRWPLIWHKTHRCMNQMALYNFTKDYELAIVCRKGNATLLTPQASSVYMGATDENTRALQHPFAKPPKLWQWLYQAVAIKGQLVLDPCAGVGTSTMAAIEYGLQPIGIEINEQYHAAAIVHVSTYYTKTLRNVRFT